MENTIKKWGYYENCTSSGADVVQGGQYSIKEIPCLAGARSGRKCFKKEIMLIYRKKGCYRIWRGIVKEFSAGTACHS